MNFDRNQVDAYFSCANHDSAENATFALVRSLIAKQLSIGEERVLLDSRFITDLKADSLDIAELMLRIEENFGVIIPDDEALAMLVVEDLVKHIDTAVDKK